MPDQAKPQSTYSPLSSPLSRFEYGPANVKESPKVTLVTVFSNTGKPFEETAKSVLQQSFQQWEWLIINDGSTSRESVGVLDNFRNVDTRIQIVDFSDHRGLGVRLNTGFRKASTPYIVQLNSLTMLEPTALEKWFWFLETFPDIGLCHGHFLSPGTPGYTEETKISEELDPKTLMKAPASFEKRFMKPSEGTTRPSPMGSLIEISWSVVRTKVIRVGLFQNY